MNEGKLHLYCGEGKGKTTAAMGLALRMLGHGKHVVILQLLKDGSSGELESLRRLGAVLLAGKPKGERKFSFQMNEQEKAETRIFQSEQLRRARSFSADLLILDEACGALSAGLVDEALLKETVLSRPAGQELVLTGREPAAWMREAADYCTEMRCVRHPYAVGLPAREGVEF